MTQKLTRVYDRRGNHIGVLSAGNARQGAQQRSTVYGSAAPGFLKMWDRATEPEAVLDKRPPLEVG